MEKVRLALALGTIAHALIKALFGSDERWQKVEIASGK